jgi:hypothetical protein
MTRIITIVAVAVVLTGAGSFLVAAGRDPSAVIQWSNEARRAIVPPGPAGVFGPENYGDKFPGEAAVYMGIAHAAIYDAIVAIDGRYKPFAAAVTAASGASADAAVATAAFRVLSGILGSPQQATLLQRYTMFIDAIPASASKQNGIAVGEQVAGAILALRADDGRTRQPQLDDLNPPAPGPGVWEPGSAPAVGLRMPGIRPLALPLASQFRPNGPSSLKSGVYAQDLAEVAAFGGDVSDVRTLAQTTQALFWTDHDLRQWNDALLALAAAHRLDRLTTARLLAAAHVSGGDAMIACFDAKYTFWFWRPYQAVPSWRPLRPTPNFPEYPSAHACHSSAVTTALESVFGRDHVPFSIDSRITHTTRAYQRFHEVVDDVNSARVLAGFHFRDSDEEGAVLGRKVAHYVMTRRFQP